MKVAHTIPLDLNVAGGVETHILSLTHALGRLGVNVDVYARKSLTTGQSQHVQDLAQFKHQNYSIIHTHSGFYSPRFWAIQMDRRRQQRHVHTLHTISLDYLFACRAWLNWRCYWCTLVEAMWSHYADHVIAVSQRTRDRALTCFHASPGKISVIPNGFIPTAPSRNARQTVRSRLGLTDDHLVLIFVGRGEDQVKGTSAVAAAMDQLFPRFPLLRLLALPGPGFRQAPWLITTGPIPHAQTMDYYTAADIFVNASLSEGMPLTVIEAMAASLPIVAAPVGGIPDLITHHQSGLLTKPDRSDLPQLLARLIEDDSLRRRLGHAAHTAAQPLTWDRIAQETAKCYESLL